MQKHYLLEDFQGLYLKDQDKGTTSVPKTMTTSMLLVSVAVTVLPLSAAYECLGRWVFGRVVCDTWLVVDVLYCTASIWNLCVIAADRFTATMFPIWYRERPTPIMPVRSHTVLRTAAFPRVSFHFGTMSAKLPCCHFNLVSQASGHCISNLVPGAPVHRVSRLFSYCEHRPSVSQSLPCLVLFGTSGMESLCIFSPFRYRGRSSFPIWYRERRSANRAGVYVAVVWVVATAACVPPMIGWTDQQNYVWKNRLDRPAKLRVEEPDGPISKTTCGRTGWTDQQNYVWKNASATFQCEPFQTPGSSVRLFVCLSVCLSVCPLIRHVSFMRHF